MRLVFKTITDQRVKKINADYFLGEVKKVMTGEVKSGIISDFKLTTKGWKNAPNFTGRMVVSANVIAIEVTPTGRVSAVRKYIGINSGIPRHTIRPRRGKALAFKSGYTPSTSPGRRTSHAYRRSGKTVMTKLVNHPGVQPRHFDLQIAAVWRPELRRHIENALRRAANRI